MDVFQTITVIAIGIGLSAACGFRVFVPLFMISVAAKADYLILSDGFEWLGSWPAVAAMAVATLLEIAAYYLPIVDNLLDTVATPSAVIAGVIATGACISDMDPLLKWSVAIIAGGGVAGIVQTGSVGVRTTSTAATAGTANPVVSHARVARFAGPLSPGHHRADFGGDRCCRPVGDPGPICLAILQIAIRQEKRGSGKHRLSMYRMNASRLKLETGGLPQTAASFKPSLASSIR